METLVKILHVIVCIFLMLTVLLQAGKGGGMGAAFGGGSSMGTVFGGSGAGNFLRRLTVGAAIIFMITSMTLAWMSTPSTDPVEKYWAQQYKAMMDREKAHKQAVGNEAKAPEDDGKETPEGEGVGPDEMVDTPEDEGEGEPIDTPEEGGESTATDEPATSDPPKPEPKQPEAKKPPAETPKPRAKPVPPPAAPVAPPPGSSSTTPP
ncbi:MAG TPA: preprotein translocase subunit SecG [Kofleriaceae bacterium]|nr:preprotein translocase subunit SecG [Kofleriaceae bacterium]